jgi:hypothetical protein
VFDELAFTGAPLPEEELVSVMINGLGIEYNSIVTAISTARCHGAFSFYDLRGLLLSHEILLKSQASSNLSAFYASRGGGTYYRQNLNPNSHLRSTTTEISSRPGSFSNGPHLHTNSHETESESDEKPIGQICSKLGHRANLCYRRHDKDPDWKLNPRFQAYNAHATSSNHTSGAN